MNTRLTMDDNANYASSTPDQFRATKVWNTIVAAVRAEMPVRKRRKGLKTFDNCFSGSEAVSWTLDYLKRNSDLLLSAGQIVNREKVALLMQKFVEQKIIQDVRGRSVTFKDSSTHLYMFNKENMAPFSGLSNPSCTDADPIRRFRNSIGDYTITFRQPIADSGSTANDHTNGGCNSQHDSSNGVNVSSSSSATSSSSSTPAVYSHIVHPRLVTPHRLQSHHHQQQQRQLHHNQHQYQKHSQNPGRHLLLHGGSAPTSLASPALSPTSSASSKELLFLSDLSSLSRHLLWRRLQQLFASGGQHIMHSHITSGTVNVPGRFRAQTDILKAFSLHITDYPAVEVCHNICQVSASGIVLPRKKDDDVPMLVMQAMKCLAKWPEWAPDYANYTNFRRETLKLVREHFCKQLILPRTLYELSIVAFAPLMSTLQEPEMPVSLQYETAFVTANPETKILPRTALRTPLPRFGSQTPSTMPRPIQYQCERLVQTCVRAASVRRIGSSMGCYVNSAFSASSSSLSSGVSTVSEANVRACREVANSKELVVRQLQHLYLVLSPKNRRALHLLLRFIHKVGQNKLLVIDEKRSNHDVLVDEFSTCLVGALRTNLEQTAMFMTFLVENCDIIFTVPESLRHEIDAAIVHRPQ